MVAWLAWWLVGWYGNAAAQQFSFRQYAQSDGLTNLAAGYLVTDPGGDLWVGTDGGLFAIVSRPAAEKLLRVPHTDPVTVWALATLATLCSGDWLNARQDTGQTFAIPVPS